MSEGNFEKSELLSTVKMKVNGACPPPVFPRPSASSALRISKESYVQPIAVAVATLRAEADEFHLPRGDVRFIRSFRHQENFRRRHRDADGLNEPIDFLQVRGAGVNKLELIISRFDPFAEDRGLEARSLMTLDPGLVDLTRVGRGTGKFRAQRGQIAGDSCRRNGAGGFDGDVQAFRSKRGGQFMDSLRNHRLSSCENAMPGRMF